jgi:hypothetical protein
MWLGPAPRPVAGGTKWRNRARQAALERALMSSGHVSEVVFDMLERLEGRSRTDAQEATQPR